MDRQKDIEQLALTFIKAMHLSLTPGVAETEDSIQIDLSGPDAYLLMERKGAVLEALQLLMGRVAEAQLGLEKRLVVDCDGFRKERELEIVEAARQAAAEVRKLGQPVELPPMNSYERRLVHLALKDEQGVRSESFGDGLIKSVVISPA